MVRAETWLHLTFGGSPRRRVSRTTTLRPRAARSIASVNPTGPAPTIATSASNIRTALMRSVVLAPARSIELGAGAPDDVGPLGRLAGDEAPELGRARRTELDARCARAGDHVGIDEDTTQFALQPGDDRRRRRRGRDDAEP